MSVEKFFSRYTLLSVNFATLIARLRIFRGILCFRGFQRMENKTLSLRRAQIFSSEKVKKKKAHLKFEVVR